MRLARSVRFPARSFSPYSPTMHAQLALDLVLSLGFDRCMLAGHADGALIALMAASFAITGPPSQPGTRRASMDRVRPMGMEPQVTPQLVSLSHALLTCHRHHKC